MGDIKFVDIAIQVKYVKFSLEMPPNTIVVEGLKHVQLTAERTVKRKGLH